ncbi:MAG: hypothetical protein KC496_09515 [Anaerolineae bacterium]|nr:hypothetical protein [Anaerolineae bacterium]
MLRFLWYRYARARMAAYVNGELPPKTRRFVARIIDEDPRCYQAYRIQRQAQQELQRTLPLVGKPQAGQLDALWQQISTEMELPEPEVIQQPGIRFKPSYSLGYGLAGGFLLLLLTLPYAMGAGMVTASAVPRQPQPHAIVTEEAPTFTMSVSATPTAVAFHTEIQGTEIARSDLHNTPAAKTPGR